jgi:predicted ATPase
MKLHLKNFRSIKDAGELEIAPLTLVYGANGAGKSSLIYGLLTLKNILLNPSQQVDGFFNYSFASLGDYEAVVFDHNTNDQIRIGIELSEGAFKTAYQAGFNNQAARFDLSLWDNNQKSVSLLLEATLPYALNQNRSATLSHSGQNFNITWNGVIAQVPAAGPAQTDLANAIAKALNAPAESLRKLRVVPHKRGFSKAHYSSVSVSPWMVSEDEVASYLSNNKYLVSKISRFLRAIVERDFRVSYQPGTAIFSLDATDVNTGITSELVNEGFGTNQLIQFLAVCLHPDSETICVEEPEIHLHPTALRRLAQALAEIAREEGKRFLISTHSEPFLAALLGMVAQGKLKPSELACYYAHKDKKATVFERQQVNDKGQIEGGLASFLAGELEDVRAILKIAKTAQE